MGRIVAVACLTAFALFMLSGSQVAFTPAGLVVKGGKAFAAEMPVPPPPPPPAPVGKGKAPIGKGKGKAPVITRG